MTALSPREREAACLGMHEGDAALARFARTGVLRLFVGITPMGLEDERLDRLRAYAELSRVLLPQGRTVPAASPAIAGFSAAQIAELDRMIAARAPEECGAA